MKKPLIYTLRWGGTSLVAMGLTYLLVGQLLAGSGPEPVTPADLQEAKELRLFSNELVDMVEEFLVRAQAAEAAQVASYKRWAAHDFRPRTNDFRQRLVHSRLSNRAHTALLAAADRCVAMSASPRNRRLTQNATKAVLEAVEQTEARIAQLRVAKRIRPGPATPSFARPQSN